MPRIVPLQLLKCLKVLLDENGGILSESEVKRIAGLMTKYSKKLVSKCIYVQILKCTKTELLGEFMGAGGWTLVHMWLNDAIRAMNWPLVQEILELLLLCPVDVDRLKSNSAPKLVRGLCKDGGIEGVRILAKRLVEQWLKVVTADNNTTSSNTNTTITAMPPQAIQPVVMSAVATTAPADIHSDKPTITVGASKPRQNILKSTKNNSHIAHKPPSKSYAEEQDPLADVPNDVPLLPSYGPTQAQKKASEAGLVYKIVVKDGQQVLTKVESSSAATTMQSATMTTAETKQTKKVEGGKEKEDANRHIDVDTAGQHVNAVGEEEEEEGEDDQEETTEPENEEERETHSAIAKDNAKNATPLISEEVVAEVESTIGTDKRKNDNESSSNCLNEDSFKTSDDPATKAATTTTMSTSPTTKITMTASSKKDVENAALEEVKNKERKDKIVKKIENKSSKESTKAVKEKETESRNIEKEKDRKTTSNTSSSSSSQKSLSGNKTISKSSSSSGSSSSGKSKLPSSSSSSSSSSHDRRSSSDKHRSSGSDRDKDRTSSSGKDRDRRNSLNDSLSKSSSSKSSSSPKSSSSGKERSSRDKERDKTSSTSALSRKEREHLQAEKDKATLASMSKQPSIDKLGKIPRKPKPIVVGDDSVVETKQASAPATSINIPSKKASSMSIEIRRDNEKTKTVKTYKSQFRSHGLTEEAPPPPSRKGLKKPPSTTTPGTSIPLSLPSSSLKRASPTPSHESPAEKKSKIDINHVSGVGVEKPGAIKLIPPKKIAQLVETNIFSDALSAATGPKKIVKRKRPIATKDGAATPPTSPEAPPKVAPLKFYQETLDETINNSKEDGAKETATTVEQQQKLETENGCSAADSDSKKEKADHQSSDRDAAIEDDDDIPLKKVKEDIEQKVRKEQQATQAAAAAAAGGDSACIEIPTSDNEENCSDRQLDSPNADKPKKPGPGCGPNGPPGVLTLHRRKGPKKKLSWRPQEELEQIRYFELDETERVNVTKTFMDMKNLERFSERDAINMSRRGFNHDDNMEPQIAWKPLVTVDGVPPHPDGNQSKERKIQADREQTTLRALYFSHSMIPDTPTEADFEPHYAHDIPVIPLDDITGNPDAVNDFTSMRWPESKGSPKQGDNIQSGTGDMFSGAPFNAAYINPFVPPGMSAPPSAMAASVALTQQKMSTPPPNLVQMVPPPGAWTTAPNVVRMPMGGPPGFNGPMPPTGSGVEMVGAPPNNFMVARHQFPPGGPPPGAPYAQFGPPPGFNGPPNFGPHPGGPMVPPGAMMNGMGPRPGPIQLMGGGPHMLNAPSGPHRGGHNRAPGGSWRSGGTNFADNTGGGGSGGGSGGNWRPAGSGQNRSEWSSGSNTGLCKGYLRGHCRQGKACKYVHPKKKRI